MPKPCPVVHFEIGCQHSEKTAKFYSDCFGWSYMPMGPANMVANIGPCHDGSPPMTTGIGGHINCLGHPPHQYVTFYILVDDLKASLDEITRAGGSMMIPPTEVPNVGWFAWFKDPEGNALGLWKAMM